MEKSQRSFLFSPLFFALLLLLFLRYAERKYELTPLFIPLPFPSLSLPFFHERRFRFALAAILNKRKKVFSLFSFRFFDRPTHPKP